MTSDLFGFLPKPISCTFAGVTISPVDEFDIALRDMSADANKDGFFYPPTVHKVKPTSDEEDAPLVPIPNTSRPLPTFVLPPSHRVEVTTKLLGDFRQEDGAFLIHALGYLFGYRLQFHDWRFEGRVPFGKSHHHVYVTDTAASHFLDCAYSKWRLMASDHRKAVTNALYMHSRVPLYEQSWERFAIEYMVFDALYGIASVVGGFSAKGHAERIEITCEKLGLWCDRTSARGVVKLRTELFHKAMWDGEHPSYQWSDSGYEAGQHLRRLNQKVIPALLGYTSGYVRSPWIQWTQVELFGP